MEEWKDIEGYEGYYQVSNVGQVRALKRKVASQWGDNRHNVKQRIMLQKTTSNGYKAVCLSCRGIRKHRSVHRLVAQAFVIGCSTRQVVNHKDCDKTNNHATNLEWCTYKENSLHSVAKGRHVRGENSPVVKLTEEEVLTIRATLKEGMTSCEVLGKMFKVSTSNIKAIKQGRTWRHLL